MAITILKEGSRSPEVLEYQHLLLFRGGATISTLGIPDGIFGPKTLAATLNFQKLKGLQQDGIVGPITWETLPTGRDWPNVVPGEFLREGDRNAAVRQLQRGLAGIHSLDVGVIDGTFGSRTKAAVITFQQSTASAGRNVEGIIGPFTFGTAINSEDNVGRPV